MEIRNPYVHEVVALGVILPGWWDAEPIRAEGALADVYECYSHGYRFGPFLLRHSYRFQHSDIYAVIPATLTVREG